MVVLQRDEISAASTFLKGGKLVAFPTETVYGLGAPIFYVRSILEIFRVKKRAMDNPLIAHIGDLSQAEDVAVEIPPIFYLLAEKFFPGPLTVVLKKHPLVPSIVSAGLETIALRMPNHEIALELIKSVGQPLVAPSANLSGRPSSTMAKHVIDDFGDSIAAVIDGGKTQYGMESTVINLVSKEPCILRYGAIVPEALEEVLQRPLVKAKENEKGSSPGICYKHYSPTALVVVFTDREKMRCYMEGRSSCLFVCEKIDSYNLYEILRLGDEEKCEEIVIYCDEKNSQDRALMDRLERAAKK
jgi:L-threonylcarbamoyladenylate synthase